jgi:site-specific DNA-cytosine methylase
MIIYDLFAGTGSATQAFKDAGHTVIKVELDEYFEAHERDILAMTAEYLITKYGQPDFIWASPPCTTFSVASIRHYWSYIDGKALPKNDKDFAWNCSRRTYGCTD